jgi:hypothetical protein
MSKIFRRSINPVIGIFVFSILASCSAVRKIYRQPLRDQGPEYLVHKLDSSRLKFDNLSARFSATYSHGSKSNSFSGQMRIERDSIIWISVSAIGIEMARFMITEDSVKFQNRINKTFLRKEFRYVNELLNNTLDFDMLQAFLTGNDFSFFENGKFKASIDNNLEYKLFTTERRKLKKSVRRSDQDINIPIEYIWLNPESYKIERVQLKEAEKGGRHFSARYKDFVSVQNQLFPASTEFDIETNDDKVNIKISLSKIELNKSSQAYPFPIPENYSEVFDIVPEKDTK